MSNRKPSSVASAAGRSAVAVKQGTPELSTLLLKEELLSEQVLVNADLIQAINDSGIPLNLTIEYFDKFNTNKDKVKKLLETFASIWKDEYFVKLCEVLETVVSPWIADELRFELLGENGTQQINETLDLENGRIVFKEFGNEKRLSEQEKRRLHQLLNRKTQTTRDIWESQLNRVAAKVDAATKRSNTMDEEAIRLAAEIQRFIAEHAGENFKNRGVTNGAQRTTDMFRTKSAVQQLERQLNFLIQLTGQCLMENDNINDEKRRVIEKIDSDAKQGLFATKSGRGPDK